MKIERLPSGSYRVRKMYKGQTYTITFDKKPSDREVTIRIAELLQDNVPRTKGTFEDYAKRYIDSKGNILSPSTLRTYESMIGRLSDDFRRTNLYDITPERIQREINDYSLNHAPKTTRSLHGFISTVFAMFRPQMSLKTSLPRQAAEKGYEPTTEDIQAILNEVKTTIYSIPFQLGVLGLRRGEICCLELSDLNNNELTINKTLVYRKGWHIKYSAKTDESNMVILIPKKLADEIRTNGKIFDGDPKRLNLYLHKMQDKLGIPRFRFHQLRSYFASYASTLNIPESDIMAMGGWKTDYVFKNIYRKSMEHSRKRSMNIIGKKILS